MLRCATTLLAAAAAGLALAACGSDDENAADTRTLPAITVETTETETTPTATAPTVTAPPAATTTAPARTTPEGTGGATVPDPGDRPADPGETGGASPGYGATGAGAPPVETIPSPAQDPECRPGTGPGFPDRPQCEPISGPDARDDEG